MGEHAGTGDPLAQLAGLQVDFRQFLGRRMKLWAIRWGIGFGLIWLAVSQFGAPKWLWWAGIGLALTTPVVAFAAQAIVSFRLARAKKRMGGLAAGIESARDR